MIINCCYCCQPAQGRFSIHRDGFGRGPEVPLCDGCGDAEVPSLEEIWRQIRVYKKAGLAVTEVGVFASQTNQR